MYKLDFNKIEKLVIGADVRLESSYLEVIESLIREVRLLEKKVCELEYTNEQLRNKK
jgi:hypothetical protein